VRKTSPCTNFQPESSCTSSSKSNWLYLAISFLRALNNVIATMPVNTTTRIKLLMRLNQWICGASTRRYLSHLVAQGVVLGRQNTLYVYVTICSGPDAESLTGVSSLQSPLPSGSTLLVTDRGCTTTPTTLYSG